jgi:carboxymethylenebutenolidase
MNQFQRYLAEEFAEEYQEKRISRRDALKLIASVLGSLLLAETFLAACAPVPDEATPGDSQPSPIPAASSTAARVNVSPDDPAIQAGPVEFPGADATLRGYLARPARDGSFPVVLVCHENRGLTGHIEDVTRRLGKAGYVGLAVDLLSRQGGSAQVGEGSAPGALGNIAPEQFVADFKSGWAHLQDLPFAEAQRVGMVGFCFGGGVTWLMAVEMPELKAAVPFYGPPPAADDIARIQAPVLAIYGEQDQRITSTASAIEALMQAEGKVFEKLIFPGADHAFHNDTGSRYNPEAARDAWARTLEWFARYL